MLYFQMWSGGKDSTASIVLEHELDLGHEPSTIVMSEVMFDLKRNISGEYPEHMEWIHTKAKPLFESWGHKVEIVRAKTDYFDNFFFEITKGAGVGKLRGFPMAGHCNINRDIKSKAIRDYLKQFKGKDITQYLGIAFDEPIRLERLKGTNKESILAVYRMPERMTYRAIKPYGLLSPVYEFSRRNGCWFCPNQSYEELARLKRMHPDLYAELYNLSQIQNTVSQYFRYNKTFLDVDEIVDEKIELQNFRERQVDIFDFMLRNSI